MTETDLRQRVEALSAQVDELSRSIAEISKSAAGHAEIDRLRAELAGVKADLEGLRAALDEVKDEGHSRAIAVAKMAAQVDSFTGRMDRLEAYVKEQLRELRANTAGVPEIKWLVRITFGVIATAAVARFAGILFPPV